MPAEYQIKRIARDFCVAEEFYFLRRDDYLFKMIFPMESRLPLVSKPDDSVN